MKQPSYPTAKNRLMKVSASSKTKSARKPAVARLQFPVLMDVVGYKPPAYITLAEALHCYRFVGTDVIF
jgi:hypothetical protein